MKIIKDFNIDYTDIPTNGGKKIFSVIGDNDASFYLEVKNEDNYYYNFTTQAFASKYAKLDGVIKSGSYQGFINFPSVSDDDQYDIYIYAKPGSKHIEPNISNFRDGSIDLNSSIGSNNNLLQKVIYQVLDITLTLSTYSAGGAVSLSASTNDEVTVSRYNSKQPQPFSISSTVTTAITVDRQPNTNDILTFLQPVVGSAPIQIPGENIYPTVTNTDTVDGAVTSGVKVVMDNNVASNMVVGDRITGNAALDAKTVTVVALNPDTDNVKEFSMSEAIAISDGVTLSFSNQKNYKWPVANAKGLKEDMIVVADTNILANTTLSKYEEITTVFQDTEDEKEILIREEKAVDKSQSLPTVSKGIETVAPGNIVFNQQQVLALAGDTLKVGGYGLEEVKRVSDWNIQITDLKLTLNTVTTTKSSGSGTSVVVASAVGIADETTQTVDGAITSSNKVVLDSVDGLHVGHVIYAVSAGSLSGNPTITNINEARKEIILSTEQTFGDGITLTFANSTISGIGIDPSAIDPYITNISSTTLTLSSSQTLENNQTFTFPGAGSTATITGNVTVNKAGSENLTLRFDVDKFLTHHT